MVVDEETKKVRQKLAKDLRDFYGLILPHLGSKIENFNFQTAYTRLSDIERVCAIDGEFKPSFWSYKINAVEFKLDKEIPKKKLPNSVSELKLIVSVEVSGDTKKENELDPFQTLAFNYTIKGDFICDKSDDIRTAITTYHLDRHLYNDGDNIPEEPHPFYHLQFGGNKLIGDGEELDTGELLVLETPRVPHHPMEFILGIDFLISNFYPKIRKTLMDGKQEYRKLIEHYQEKIIKPYYFAIASNWDKNLRINTNSPNWTPNSLHPQISELD